MRRLAALLAAAALSLSAGRAGAEPTLWQRARAPNAEQEYAGLVRLERGLERARDPNAESLLVPELSMGALLLLKLSHLNLDTVQDPRLCFLVARALLDVQSAPGLQVTRMLEDLLTRPADAPALEAKRLLERALSLAPSSPLAADGQFNLALIEGQLGDHAGERAAYLRAIALEWSPEQRAVAYMNLAESDMGLGNLARSVREYRRALGNASERPDVRSLAGYGLAVALERSGDLPRALAEAELANRVQLAPGVSVGRTMLDLPNVTFSPPYEIHYYKALAAMAGAQSARELEARRDALADAIEHWEAYLVRAEVDHTPWAQNARLREARARKELATLNAQSGGAR